MARPAKQSLPQDEMPLSETVTEIVTYMPRERTDPVSVTWAGRTFHANDPVEMTGRQDGTDRERLNFHIIERARENRCFVVGNERPKRDAKKRPETAEEYRAHMVDWLNDVGRSESSIRTVDELIGRFAKDIPLQEACGVGTDDFAFLGSLFMPKLYALQKAEEMTDNQVAKVWIGHGVNMLPWAG
jgi:hypothetical protein